MLTSQKWKTEAQETAPQVRGAFSQNGDLSMSFSNSGNSQFHRRRNHSFWSCDQAIVQWQWKTEGTSDLSSQTRKAQTLEMHWSSESSLFFSCSSSKFELAEAEVSLSWLASSEPGSSVVTSFHHSTSSSLTSSSGSSSIITSRRHGFQAKERGSAITEKSKTGLNQKLRTPEPLHRNWS